MRIAHTSVRLFLGLAAGLICTAVLAIGATVWWLHTDAIDNASKKADDLALVLSSQIGNSVRSIDLVLNEIREQVKSASADSNNINSLLRSRSSYKIIKQHLAQLHQAEFIGILGKHGNILNTTRAWPAPEINVADRAYYEKVENSDDNEIHISNPLRDRIQKLHVIIFSKRISGPNNEFLGIVTVGVKLSYFQSIYESISSLSNQSFLLAHRDGAVIARYPTAIRGNDVRIPRGSPWYRLVTNGGGEYLSRGYFDSIARLVAVRPLRDYPLVVDVGISESGALATWRVQAATIGAGTLIVLLCSGALLGALNNNFNRLITSEGSLLNKTKELEQATLTVDVALNNMSQGLVMFDASNRMKICNRRYLEIYGLSPQIIKPGCTLREILDHRVAMGSFFSDSYESYLAEVLSATERREAFTKLTRLPDGRVISITNQPIADGGWLATHEDVTEAKLAEERIHYAAQHDPLTGLPNRSFFGEWLGQALKRAGRGERLAVMYLDVDHLKRINDTLGHPTGDKLLKVVADRIRSCVRDVDFVARLSGDEFAIIQSSIAEHSDAAELALRVREAIRRPIDIDGQRVGTDVSIGISLAPNDGAKLNELLKMADIALYEAKNGGRGAYCFYEPEMNERMQERDKLERDLQGALENGEFELLYQPIVDTHENKILTCEALLRWRHPTRGLVPPGEFVPVAEENGLINSLGEWVLRTACAEAAIWPEDISVAVNLSSVQLVNKNLTNIVINAIASAGMRFDRLILELTESVFLKNTDENLGTLKRLHELGVRLSMDDFGTGYSSLGYLLTFPFSKIKIDRRFVAGLAYNEQSRVVVRSISDLARGLKMRVVAEGVEEKEQLHELHKLGCFEIQGFLFSRPLPAEGVRKMLSGNRPVEKASRRV